MIKIWRFHNDCQNGIGYQQNHVHDRKKMSLAVSRILSTDFGKWEKICIWCSNLYECLQINSVILKHTNNGKV